jgi:hypothetical protein
MTLGVGVAAANVGFGANEGSGAAAGGFGVENGEAPTPGIFGEEVGVGAPGGLAVGFGSEGVAGGLVKADAPGKEMDAGAGGGSGSGGATGVGGSEAIGSPTSGCSVVAAWETALAALIGRILPNILVTLSGTAVTRWPARRPRSVGSMEARIWGRGKLTTALS